MTVAAGCPVRAPRTAPTSAGLRPGQPRLAHRRRLLCRETVSKRDVLQLRRGRDRLLRDVLGLRRPGRQLGRLHLMVCQARAPRTAPPPATPTRTSVLIRGRITNGDTIGDLWIVSEVICTLTAAAASRGTDLHRRLVHGLRRRVQRSRRPRLPTAPSSARSRTVPANLASLLQANGAQWAGGDGGEDQAPEGTWICTASLSRRLSAVSSLSLRGGPPADADGASV